MTDFVFFDEMSPLTDEMWEQLLEMSKSSEIYLLDKEHTWHDGKRWLIEKAEK